MTQTISGPWALEAGEHVCWRAGSAHDYAAGCDALSAYADRYAGGLIILEDSFSEPASRAADPASGFDASAGIGTGTGPSAGYVSAAVWQHSANSALTAARERVHQARRGSRMPWVLAPMEHLTSPDAPAAEVVAVELGLAELAADTGTGVVCAYRNSLWKPALLGDIAAVHSRVVGFRPTNSEFRLRSTGAHGYALEGTVGFESLSAFTAALHGALLRTPRLRLGCERLELIDAAAWRALIETVAATPGASVILAGANETVRGVWLLSGYRDSGTAVQVQP